MNPAYNYVPVNNPNIPLANPASPYQYQMGVIKEMSELTNDLYDPGIYAPGGEIRIRDMYLPNVSLRTYQGQFARNAMLVNENGENLNLVGSCLFLEGSATSLLPGETQGIVTGKGQQNFKFDPENEYAHWFSGGKPFHILHFSIDPEYFVDFLPEDEAWANRLKGKLQRRQRILADTPAYITLAQHKALQNIFDCPMTGRLGQLMMETSIIQIVLWQLHALFKQTPDSRQSKIAARDLEVMQSVREYLTRNFLEDHSIAGLARYFGTNTNKLMTLFKKSFGISIFEYISELKMGYALKLLQDKRSNVTEVARALRYKNPHHFSAAFKKKHGVNPSTVK
jgi:AraC-like DNA-binding protein